MLPILAQTVAVHGPMGGGARERLSFAATAPPAAAVDWQRAWRDIESRLRAWTAELRCHNCHHPGHDTGRVMPDDEWESWLALASPK